MKINEEAIWQTTPTQPRRSASRWKSYLNESCPHGLRIALVDGTHVRNHFDSDFSQGGNGHRFGFVPRREIWIDQEIAPEEWPFIAFHECQEVERMKKGLSYDAAHDQAKRLEDGLRKIAQRRQDRTLRRSAHLDKDEPPIVTPASYLEDPNPICPICGQPAEDVRDRIDPREWTGTGGLLTFRSCGSCHYRAYLDN